MLRAVVASGFLVVAVLRASPAAAPAPAWVHYRPPVGGPVIDGFRPPATPFGPGNRGLDYATTPGEPVLAAATGVVVFAGPVGGPLVVVIAHADRLRTSYTGLASLAVVTGATVAAGVTVGWAGPSLHLGARAGDAYVDPALLFDPSPRWARLVPVSTAALHLAPGAGSAGPGAATTRWLQGEPSGSRG